MIPASLQWIADELENWGRWGRDPGGAPMNIPEPSIWQAWLSFRGRIAGYGLTIAEKEAEARGEIVEVDYGSEPPPRPIDEHAAFATDWKMRGLSITDKRSYAVLHKYYYRRRPVDIEDLFAAMRYYGDLP